MTIKAIIYRHICGKTDVLLLDAASPSYGYHLEDCDAPKPECDPQGLTRNVSGTQCMGSRTAEMNEGEILQAIQVELRRQEGMKGVEPGVLAVTTFGGERSGSRV